MDCKRRFYVLYGFGVANVPATRRGRLETLAIAAVLFSSPYPLLVAVSSSRRRILSSLSDRIIRPRRLSTPRVARSVPSPRGRISPRRVSRIAPHRPREIDARRMRMFFSWA